MIFLLSIISIIWFYREMTHFPIKINRHVYEDYISLTASDYAFGQFLQKTHLKVRWCHKMCWLFFPSVGVLFSSYSITVLFIALILVYLSLLDYLYYLTDVNYIGIIFMLSLGELLLSPTALLENHLLCLLATALFLSAFAKISQAVLKREGLGSGDVLLLIALSPLWTIAQMLLLLLYASSFAVLFYLGASVLTRVKPAKLPFIPFIGLSWAILCLQYQ